MHLAGIGVSELAALQIDDDETPKLAMEEQQIDAIPFVADAKATLASDKSEIAAELQKKTLEMQNQRFFDVGLGIFFLEPEELENVRVFDFFLGRERVFGFCGSAFAEHFRFVPRKRGALVKQRIDLTVELTHAPAAAQCLGFVKFSCLLVFY